jgi:hypothetical protein
MTIVLGAALALLLESIVGFVISVLLLLVAIQLISGEKLKAGVIVGTVAVVIGYISMA